MDLEKMIEEVAPQVREKLAARTAEQIAESLSWTLRTRIAEHTEKYINEHVLPDVTARLKTDHDKIVTAVCESVAAACNGLRDALIEHAQKQLANEYSVREIGKALFGGRY